MSLEKTLEAEARCVKEKNIKNKKLFHACEQINTQTDKPTDTRGVHSCTNAYPNDPGF